MNNVRKVTKTVLPHNCFGNPICCGTLDGFTEGDRAQIACNACGAVVATMPANELSATVTEMELTLDFASAKCPHCERSNIFAGLAVRPRAYTCSECGRFVNAADQLFSTAAHG